MAQHEYPSARAGWWATMVFFLLYALSFIDRQMLNLLVEPIKATLKVSDFEVSLLQGMTFALFYTVFGVAIGWMVDNGPRKRLVFAGVVLWSVACAGCGLAARYWQLALGRVGVAVGEATLAPAAYSMMSDIFPPRRLAMPMSVMGSGAPVGTALAMIIGSYVMATVPAGGLSLPLVGQLEAWQFAFVVVGVPGLLLAPLIYTVVEPARRKHAAAAEPDAAPRSGVLTYLSEHRRFYFGHFAGFALYSMVNYGVSAWLPTFLIRRHGLELSEAGYASGIAMFVFSTLGSVGMGLAVDRWYSSGRKDAHLLFFVGCVVVQIASIILAVAADDPYIALALLIPQIALSGFTGVAAAALQIGTPANIRGQVSAIYLLVFNLVGLGLGPTAVAFCTDFVFRDEARVGSSLVLTYVIFAPLAALCMLSATRAMRERAESV